MFMVLGMKWDKGLVCDEEDWATNNNRQDEETNKKNCKQNGQMDMSREERVESWWGDEMFTSPPCAYIGKLSWRDRKGESLFSPDCHFKPHTYLFIYMGDFKWMYKAYKLPTPPLRSTRCLINSQIPIRFSILHTLQSTSHHSIQFARVFW